MITIRKLRRQENNVEAKSRTSPGPETSDAMKTISSTQSVLSVVPRSNAVPGALQLEASAARS